MSPSYVHVSWCFWNNVLILKNKANFAEFSARTSTVATNDMQKCYTKQSNIKSRGEIVGPKQKALPVPMSAGSLLSHPVISLILDSPSLHQSAIEFLPQIRISHVWIVYSDKIIAVSWKLMRKYREESVKEIFEWIYMGICQKYIYFFTLFGTFYASMQFYVGVYWLVDNFWIAAGSAKIIINLIPGK